MALNFSPDVDPLGGQHNNKPPPPGVASPTPLPARMFAVPVVLFGYGVWAKKNWLPVLAQLAQWCVVRLTVVDRWREAPAELVTLIQEGVLDYLSWDRFAAAPEPWLWQIAFVVTSADSHLRVIHTLVHRVPTLRIVVCEKPCGEDGVQLAATVEECRRVGVLLLISDHYLLRPNVQYLLKNPHILRNIGEILRITVAMNEVSAAGPGQGVIADMAVHELHLLCLVLFPGAEFVPDTTFVACAQHNTHTDGETYCFSLGHLLMLSGLSVPCKIECGKQLADRKEVLIVGTEGDVHMDLIANTFKLSMNKPNFEETLRQWKPTWSYARLVFLTILSLNTLQPAPSQQT